MLNLDSSKIDALIEAVKDIELDSLVKTEQDAYDVKEELLKNMPPELRCLYPEDDTLAALAYAPIYYGYIKVR